MRTVKEYRYVIAASLMCLISVALVVGTTWLSAVTLLDEVDALSLAFAITATTISVAPACYAWLMLLDEVWAVRYQRMLRARRKREAMRMALGRPRR